MTTALDALLTEARERVTNAAHAPPAYWAEMTAGLARNLLAPGAPPTRAALLAVAVAALAGAAAIEEGPRLVLLPGGLLGRVVSAPCPRGIVRVQRWALLDWPTASAQPYGWSDFGELPEARLRTEGVEGHHHYAAASAAAGDAPIV